MMMKILFNSLFYKNRCRSHRWHNHNIVDPILQPPRKSTLEQIRKKSQRVVASSLLLSLCITPVSAQNQDVIDSLPNLGSSSAQYLSKKQASLLGAAYIRQARSAMRFVEDPILLEYLKTLGEKLLQHSDDSLNAPKQFSFYLINNPAINAFAVPGGHIAINTGLIENADNEAELASVLAHEIAHVTQNHTARGIESARYDNLISLATILVAAAAGSAEGAQAGIAASTGGLVQKRLAYSRHFEREADASGIRTLYKAGYDPSATANFFQKLLSANRFNGINAPEFLLSHPLTVSRISEAEQRIKSYPITGAQGQQPKINSQAFIDIKARVTALFGNNPARISQQLAAQLLEKPNDTTQLATLHYQQGLTLARINQGKTATEHLRQAATLAPQQLDYQIALAETELEHHNKSAGLNLFRQLYQQHRTTKPSIALYYANALILNDNSRDAISILNESIQLAPREPNAYFMLARAYGENGRLYDSYVARAEHHYLRGNFSFAVKQLDNAIAIAPNEIEKSIQQAKQAKIKRELAETRKALR